MSRADPVRSLCRSPPRGQRICGTPCAAPTTCSGSTGPPGGDEVFRQLVCARIIEPTSKQDSLRVLDETGVAGPSYPTLNRRLVNVRFQEMFDGSAPAHG